MRLRIRRGGRAAEGAPLLREYAVDPASRVRIPPSPPAVWAFALMAVISLWPEAARTGANHPASTTQEVALEPVETVHLRVLDEIEARQFEISCPLREVQELPHSSYSLVVRGFTRNFVLTEPPQRRGERGSTPQKGRTSGPKQKSGLQGRWQGPNPAAFIQFLHNGEPDQASWVFKQFPHLFQPRNPRYTVFVLGAEVTEKSKQRARSSAGQSD